MSPRVRQLWTRFWHEPVAPVRPYLLLKGLLLLLAFDVWIALVPRAARYGLGFNVAHFGVLDTLFPEPTPALYAGLCSVVGFLALLQVADRPRRLLLFAIAALYTAAWAISMLDNYQHHYLLSLLLVCCCFFPIHLHHRVQLMSSAEAGGTMAREPTPVDRASQRRALKEARKRGKKLNHRRPDRRRVTPELPKAPQERSRSVARAASAKSRRHDRTSHFGYVLIGATCAIVYFYTAITKLDPDWLAGGPIKTLLAGRVSGPAGTDPSSSTLVGMLSLGAVGLQLASVVGFLLAIKQDCFVSVRWRRFAQFMGLVPLAFHVGAEFLSLRIGWFGYYMLGITAIVFAPRRWLEVAFSWLTAPVRKLRTLRLSPVWSTALTVAAALLAFGLLTGYALEVDLPGARGIALIAAFVFALLVARPLFLGRNREARQGALAAVVAAGCMWFASSRSVVRFEFWEKRGRALVRLGQLDQALVAYQKANRYFDPNCPELTDSRRRNKARRCDRRYEQEQIEKQLAKR